MIDLTDDQIEAMNTPDGTPPRARNPRTNETFVLLRVEESQRCEVVEYDDSPWTREDLQSLAWEAGKRTGWQGMDEYDDIPEKP